MIICLGCGLFQGNQGDVCPECGGETKFITARKMGEYYNNACDQRLDKKRR